MHHHPYHQYHRHHIDHNHRGYLQAILVFMFWLCGLVSILLKELFGSTVLFLSFRLTSELVYGNF